MTCFVRRSRSSAAATAILMLAVALVAASAAELPGPAAAPPGGCGADNAGIALSPGFCATVFADNLGHARHLVVARNGVVYVNTWTGAYYRDQPPAGGFLIALRDSRGVGRADVMRRFGDSAAEGSAGGTGIALYKG